jgi:hypothetical protein
MAIRPRTFLLTMSFALTWLAWPLRAAEDSRQPSASVAQGEFSAEDFDWREVVPRLTVAADLPGEQGIRAVLENSRVLRAYIENEVREECKREGNSCAAKGDASMLEEELTKRIDAIIQKGIFRQHKKLIVDYQLERQPFPFSEIVAVKSDNQRDAYLILQLAGRSYTAAQLQEKYGAPQDTDIYQWYSIYKYQVDARGYTEKAVFEINPVNGAVIKVAVSVKAKKRH